MFVRVWAAFDGFFRYEKACQRWDRCAEFTNTGKTRCVTHGFQLLGGARAAAPHCPETKAEVGIANRLSALGARHGSAIECRRASGPCADEEQCQDRLVVVIRKTRMSEKSPRPEEAESEHTSGDKPDVAVSVVTWP